MQRKFLKASSQSNHKEYALIMPSRKLIWIFCFEYAGIAKVGGLGEVSANQTEKLVSDPQLDLHVFMPSSGKHQEMKEKHNFTPLLEKDGRKLVLRGHFDPAYFGITGPQQMHMAAFSKYQSVTDVGAFEVEIWHGLLKNVPIYLLVGVNPIASLVLNDNDVYSSTTLS